MRNSPENLVNVEIAAPASRERWKKPFMGYPPEKLDTSVDGDVFNLQLARKNDVILEDRFIVALAKGVLMLAEERGYPIGRKRRRWKLGTRKIARGK